MSAANQQSEPTRANGLRARPANGSVNGIAGLVLVGVVLAALCLVMVAKASTVGPAVAAGAVAVAFAVAAGVSWVLLKPLLDRRQHDQLLALLGKAIEASREGQLITDARGVSAYANRAYREMVGAQDDQLAANPTALRGAAEQDVVALAELKEAAQAGRARAVEADIVGVDGKRRALGIRVKPLGDAGHVVWYVSDLGQRRELEHMVAEQQGELSAFLDNAPVGFYAIDGSGRFAFVNNTLAEWLGRPRRDFVKGQIAVPDVIASGGAGTISAEDLLRGIPNGQTVLRGARGNVFPVEITQQAIYGNDGKLRYLRGAFRDLTQEAAVQTTLVQAEERFRRFFDFAPIGVVSLDTDLNVVEANAAFRQMVGAASSTFEGRPALELVRAEDRGEFSRALEYLRAGNVMNGPLEVRLRGDTQRVAQVYLSRITAAEGGAGVVMHLIDSTDQKNLELQFAQSQKMQAVGQLAGGIAHDFNNLLTAMIGFCDLLLMRHQAGDESFSDIMQVKQNANRAANLVRQLLAFSRQQTLRPRVLDITDVLTELSHLLRRLIGEAIELKVVHGRDLGLVKVDYGQLEQVIINLAVNARDAMANQNGSTLTIRTANVTADESMRLSHELMPAGEYVMIEMSDTGHGIAPENLGKIFEPFFTTKEVGAGTGLGLSTVYGIIKQTGGFIFPESKPGQGAIFRIYLPRHVNAGQEIAPKGVEPMAQQDLTGNGIILLVEDEDAVRTFAARALRNKGYTVLEADSGESALELVRKHDGQIDLLISDVVMPQMDGPTLVRNVRELRPETKIIFISGYAEDAFRKSLNQPDAREINFLPKPFSLKQLAGKVKEVMTAGSA